MKEEVANERSDIRGWRRKNKEKKTEIRRSRKIKKEKWKTLKMMEMINRKLLLCCVISVTGDLHLKGLECIGVQPDVTRLPVHVITHDPANCTCALRQHKIIAYVSAYILIYNQSGEKETFLYLFIHLRTKQWRSVHLSSVVGHDTMKSGRWLTSISEETMPQLSPVPWQFVTKFPPKKSLTHGIWHWGRNVTNHSH